MAKTKQSQKEEIEVKIPRPEEIPIGKTVYIGRLKIRGTKQPEKKEPEKPSGNNK